MAGFKDIIGHEQIIEHLQNAIGMDKVSHAYIINGPDKSGKMMLAEAFAMALQCEKHGKEACMECHSCRQALGHNQPDIIYVNHEKPNTISVDDIRTQIDDATNAVKDIAGQAPQVLRPVGGGVNSDVKAVAAELGYPIINWSVDTEDWKYRDADHVKKAIVEQAQDGDVVLMHDLYETSVRGALAAIDELQSRTDKTYAFVTVSQLAAIHGITLEPGVVYNALSDEVAQQIADGSYSPTEFT